MLATSLDSAGLYHFKDPDDANVPVHFTATTVELTYVSGVTNFFIEFLGMLFSHKFKKHGL